MMLQIFLWKHMEKQKGQPKSFFFSAVSLASNGASSQCLDHHDFINTLIQIFQDTQDML